MTESCRESVGSILDGLWKNGATHDLGCQFVRKDGTVLEALMDSSVIDDPVWAL